MCAPTCVGCPTPILSILNKYIIHYIPFTYTSYYILYIHHTTPCTYLKPPPLLTQEVPQPPPRFLRNIGGAFVSAGLQLRLLSHMKGINMDALDAVQSVATHAAQRAQRVGGGREGVVPGLVLAVEYARVAEV